MKICPKCATENRDSARYCNGCGTVFKIPEREVYNDTNDNIAKREETSVNNNPIANSTLTNPEITSKSKDIADSDFTNRELSANQAAELNKTTPATKNKRVFTGVALILIFCLLLLLIVSSKKPQSKADNSLPDEIHVESSDTTQYTNDVKYSDVKYSLEEFGNINFCIPEGWHKENVTEESSQKEIKYYNSLNTDDFCMFYDLSMMDIDYSLGVERIIDTALSNFDNDSIKEVVIDGVKFKYADYTVENGDVRYQRLYAFPCSENELGILMIAWKHDGSEELQFLEHIVNSISLSKKLPDDIAMY